MRVTFGFHDHKKQALVFENAVSLRYPTEGKDWFVAVLDRDGSEAHVAAGIVAFVLYEYETKATATP